ncbi:MAG TPA: hypothetical protein VK638_20660 [Edaphobacter sp.]|nr:hypothetical protein [Edaphobacter sp.]
MQKHESQISGHDKIASPVEERHIDYILEEEFSLNPHFLRFFLQQARLTAIDEGRIVGFADESDCFTVRSATTGKGETDVLVKYGAQNGGLPIAILIEDKIRAGFQPDQAERYRNRGQEGKGKDWSDYWTCLVSHSKYFVDRGDFDAVVTLQALQEYFAKETDERSLFRARILKQTILKYEATGIQNIDPGMTHFRAMYAAECAKSLKPGQWECDKARDAWWDDNWFSFRDAAWPQGVKVVHQARTGFMKLVLPIRENKSLQGVVEECAAWDWDPNGSAPSIAVVPFGQTKSAFVISVPKITDFSIAAQPPLFEEFFAALEFLASFYRRCSALLPEALRISSTHEDLSLEGDSRMRALRAMLLGFMRSTVTCLGTEMPYPLPDLRRLTAATPEEERYFASLGLMGGFLLELQQDERKNPYILSKYWSRQWGAHFVSHKITVSEVLELEGEDEV